MTNDELLDQATTAFREAIGHNEDFVASYIDQAIALYDRGEHDRAISYYDMMIQLNPYDEMLYRARGANYSKKREYERAVSDYQKAISIDPNYVDAYFELAEVYQAWGDAVAG